MTSRHTHERPIVPVPQTIAGLVHRLEEVLASVIAPGSCWAFLDYPFHANVGDAAIWVGERRLLGALGARIRYMSDISAFSARLLARRLPPEGGILLHGGGNLGDLWPEHQQFRENVIAAFPDRPVIQLPQSLCFRSREALARARQVMNAHPDLALLLRDEPSLQIARNEFRARSLLCPDAAFALWPLRRAGEADLDVLWLHRTDHESAARERAPAGWTVADWVAEPKGWAGLVRRPLRRLNRRRGGPVQEAVVIGALYDLLARQRVEFGRRLLSRARVVVSDRLHAHVLSLLLGIPHVVVNDRYDKLRSFYETWSRGLDLARFADSPRAAAASVRTLLEARPAASLAGRASTSSP